MAGTLSFSLAASGDTATRRFTWAGGQLVCTEGPPPGQEVDLYFDDSDRPFRLRKALQYDREFKKFRIENPTGVAQDFELQVSEPGNKVVDRSYVGQELSLTGDLTVPSSPLTSEGGYVHEFGDSFYNNQVTTAGVAQYIDVLTAAANVNGAFIRKSWLAILSIGVNGAYFPVSFSLSNSVTVLAGETPGLFTSPEEFYVPPGVGIKFNVTENIDVRGQLSYDIL